jgi:hypothetical protein
MGGESDAKPPVFQAANLLRPPRALCPRAVNSTGLAAVESEAEPDMTGFITPWAWAVFNT